MRKTVLSAVLSATIFASIASFANAGSATWDLNPGSGDWNTAANWTPMTVPNASTDTATFALSNTTILSISANTEVTGITFTPAATNSYRIFVNPTSTLTLSGITNNSGVTQMFVTGGDEAGNGGQIVFNSASLPSIIDINNAGGSTVFNGSSTAAGGIGNGSSSMAGRTVFNDTSSAGTAQIGNTFFGSTTTFNNSSTAGSASFENVFGGSAVFNNSSTAGSATFTNFEVSSMAFNNSASAGNASITNNHFASVFFLNSSTAGSATFINNDNSVIGFGNTSTAGNATINNFGGFLEGNFGPGGSSTSFSGNSTAGSATLIAEGAEELGAFPAAISFGDTSTAGSATLVANGATGGAPGGVISFGGASSGGISRVEVFGNGNLDLSGHNAPGVTVGSIEGDGDIFLGANNLTVGSNNLSTTFEGEIQDGSLIGLAATGGSLTKIGTGTLVLTEASKYTGNTNINGGVLQVDGSITSNTFVNHSGTLAGTGTIQANVTNNGGAVSPGDSPGTLTITGNFAQHSGTLLIDIAGANAGQFSVLNVLGTANLAGFLDPVLLNGFVPTIGESFTFLDYVAVTGSLFIFDRNIDNAVEHWEVTYEATDAILTVAPGNVPIPDHGSTLLLLTLSVLALVTYQRQSRRKRA